MPTNITDHEFKKFFDLNKIHYANAEHIKRKKDGRVLQMFSPDLSGHTETDALISENLACQETGITYEVEEFGLQFRSRSSSTAKVLDTWPNTVGQNKNVSSVVRTIQTKEAQTKKPKNQSVPTLRDHMLHLTEGVLNTDSRHSSNMWLINKNICLNRSSEALYRHPKTHTFTFAANQLVQFVANVVMQVGT